MPVAPDLRKDAGLTNEGIVPRNAAVLVEPHHHAVVVRGVLGGVRFQVAPGRRLPLSHADEDVAGSVEHDPGAVVSPAPGLGLEDLLYRGQLIVLKPAPDHRGGGLLAPQRLGIADVEEAVRGEVRVGNHVQEPALAPGEHFGKPCHRLWEQTAVPDDPKSARPLRHQHVAAGEEGDGPGVHQALRHGFHAEAVIRGMVNVLGEGR